MVVACTSKKEQNEDLPIDKTEQLAENLKNVEVQIEGMTCEIGCARLIQSKLSKTEGITFVQVSFEEKIGNLTFDETKISSEKIKESIQKIAGGETYKVIGIKEVTNFSAFRKDTIGTVN